PYTGAPSDRSPAYQPPRGDSSWRSAFLNKRGTTPRYARRPTSCSFNASSTHCARALAALSSPVLSTATTNNGRTNELMCRVKPSPEITQDDGSSASIILPKCPDLETWGSARCSA